MYSEFEKKRRKIQKSLDSNKTKCERNKLGQFSTPTSLAIDIIRFARKLIPSTRSIRFLDPAFGTGSLYSALLNIFPIRKITKAVGIEIDPHYANPAKDLWKYFNVEIKIEDFTKLKEPDEVNRFDLVICNPPYRRIHKWPCRPRPARDCRCAWRYRWAERRTCSRAGNRGPPGSLKWEPGCG